MTNEKCIICNNIAVKQHHMNSDSINCIKCGQYAFSYGNTNPKHIIEYCDEATKNRISHWLYLQHRQGITYQNITTEQVEKLKESPDPTYSENTLFKLSRPLVIVKQLVK